MKTRNRSLLRSLLLAPCLLAPLACAGNYPAMLRQRDQTIRELETRLAATQSDNEALRSRNAELDERNRELANRKPEVIEVSTPRQDDLDSLRKAIDDPRLHVHYSKRGLSIGIPNEVTFASGSASVSKDGHRVLERVARVVNQRFADKMLFIEGHTDTDPIQKTKDKFRSNRHLSAERADAVAASLEKAGVEARRMVILGYGPWDPATPGNKDANRRVEIVVVAQ